MDNNIEEKREKRIERRKELLRNGLFNNKEDTSKRFNARYKKSNDNIDAFEGLKKLYHISQKRKENKE